MKKTIIVIVVIALVAAGAFFVFRDSDSNGTQSNDQSSQTTEDTSLTEEPVAEVPEDEADAEVASTITYTDDGFSVDNQTVSAGETIQIVNDSDDTLDFASNVHPVHSDNSELNVGFISPGESTTFVINQTGTWGFHNHLNSGHLGEITVE